MEDNMKSKAALMRAKKLEKKLADAKALDDKEKEEKKAQASIKEPETKEATIIPAQTDTESTKKQVEDTPKNINNEINADEGKTKLKTRPDNTIKALDNSKAPEQSTNETKPTIIAGEPAKVTIHSTPVSDMVLKTTSFITHEKAIEMAKAYIGKAFKHDYSPIQASEFYAIHGVVENSGEKYAVEIIRMYIIGSTMASASSTLYFLSPEDVVEIAKNTEISMIVFKMAMREVNNILANRK